MNSNKAKTRINRFDNLKGLAIFLIVLGHMAFTTKFLSINFVHNFVFIFHLAIFFFVAGYFSKIDLNQPIKVFKRILIPYILVTVVFWIFHIPFGKPSQGIFIYPTYALWFLLALFFMKMALPILAKLKYPILFSLIIALFMGFIKFPHDILGLSRTFSFLPVFVTGFFYKEYKEKFEKKSNKISLYLKNNKTIIPLSIIILSISILVAYFFPLRIIMMKQPYDGSSLINISLRALIIVLGIMITLILNKYMTNKECFLTKWGKNSMAIYILHIFIIVLFKNFSTSFLYGQGEIFSLLFAFIVSILIVTILSMDWITEYFNKIMDFFANIILNES